MFVCKQGNSHILFYLYEREYYRTNAAYACSCICLHTWHGGRCGDVFSLLQRRRDHCRLQKAFFKHALVHRFVNNYTNRVGCGFECAGIKTQA